MRYDMVNPDVSLKSEVGISREARMPTIYNPGVKLQFLRKTIKQHFLVCAFQGFKKARKKSMRQATWQ